MDTKIFWLIGFVLIGITGGMLIFARRYKNQDEFAGRVVAGCTLFLLLLWIIAGIHLME